MSEQNPTTHTPGPWTVFENIDDYGISFVINEFKYSGMVAQQPTIDANMRLIAAAPELLSACRTALAYIEGRINNLSPGEMFNALDSAIAKAEGRS